MNRKIFFDFVNNLFILLAGAFVFSFFVLGDRIGMIKKLMQLLVPVALFLFLLLISIRFKRSEIRKKEASPRQIAKVVHFSYFDLMFFDVIIYILPIVFLVVSFTYDKTIGLDELINSVLVVIILQIWKSYLFAKNN